MSYIIIAICFFYLGYRISPLANMKKELIELKKENEKLRYFLRQTKPKAR